MLKSPDNSIPQGQSELLKHPVEGYVQRDNLAALDSIPHVPTERPCVLENPP